MVVRFIGTEIPRFVYENAQVCHNTSEKNGGESPAFGWTRVLRPAQQTMYVQKTSTGQAVILSITKHPFGTQEQMFGNLYELTCSPTDVPL